MSDMKANRNGDSALTELIRKQLGSKANRRFLVCMPAFKTEAGIPERLSTLLGELDSVERPFAGQRR